MVLTADGSAEHICTCERKRPFFQRKKLDAGMIKNVFNKMPDSIHACAMSSELPSNTSTMNISDEFEMSAIIANRLVSIETAFKSKVFLNLLKLKLI